MKKLFLILIPFLFVAKIFSSSISVTAGYAPTFMNIQTNNELISCSLNSNGGSIKANYFINDKLGISCNCFSTLFPSFIISEYSIELNNNNEPTKILKEKTSIVDIKNNYTYLQLGCSFLGDCNFCFFNPQLLIDLSIITLNKQTAFFTGLCFDYSYNQHINNFLISIGFNTGFSFFSFNNIEILNTNTSNYLYKFSPYFNIGFFLN